MGKGWKTAGKLEAAQKKGAKFTKFAREIAVAARMGGPDPEANSRLKLAIAAAREASCPKDTIERAIKKGAGLDEGAQIEEVIYEGYGPHGVGIIVECQTDNRNRTVAEIRNYFKSHGGALGETNAVAWMFDRVSLVHAKKADVKDPEEEAIEVGASDVAKEDEANVYSFFGGVEELDAIRTGLTKRGWEVTVAELSFKPKDLTEVSETQKAEIFELLKVLEENDDSHRVHATIE
jgi:YebC/PmpR family DNA-binding regulatory protein